MADLVDYTYYSVTFRGSAIAQADFARLYLRAYTIIDLLTFGRMTQIQKLMPTDATAPADPAKVTEDGIYNNQALEAVRQDQAYHISDPEAITALKNAICAVAEEYQRLDRVSGNQEIASERVGNNSVTYVSNTTASLSDDAKLKRVARQYLASTGLMYSGVRDYSDVDLWRYWGWWY